MFLGRPLGKTFDGPVFTFSVGGVGKSSECSESENVMVSLLFFEGGLEAAVGVLTSAFNFGFEPRVFVPAVEIEGGGEGLSIMMIGDSVTTVDLGLVVCKKTSDHIWPVGF